MQFIEIQSAADLPRGTPAGWITARLGGPYRLVPETCNGDAFTVARLRDGALFDVWKTHTGDWVVVPAK